MNIARHYPTHMEYVRDIVIRVLATALITMAGVWFVVDQSNANLRSYAESIDRRVADIQTTILTRDLFDARLDLLRLELADEFSNTRGTVRRASVIGADIPRSENVLASIASSGDADLFVEVLQENGLDALVRDAQNVAVAVPTDDTLR